MRQLEQLQWRLSEALTCSMVNQDWIFVIDCSLQLVHGCFRHAFDAETVSTTDRESNSEHFLYAVQTQNARCAAHDHVSVYSLRSLAQSSSLMRVAYVDAHPSAIVYRAARTELKKYLCSAFISWRYQCVHIYDTPKPIFSTAKDYFFFDGPRVLQKHDTYLIVSNYLGRSLMMHWVAPIIEMAFTDLSRKIQGDCFLCYGSPPRRVHLPERIELSRRVASGSVVSKPEEKSTR